MAKTRDLTRLPLERLTKLIRHSALVDRDKALAFYLNLQRIPLYQTETALQITLASALVQRMRSSREFDEVTALLEFHESQPHLQESQLLQELYAQALVIQARKDPTVKIHGSSLNKLHRLSKFGLSLVIQRSAGELFLESIANCKSVSGGRELARQFRRLPGISEDATLRKMALQAERLAEEMGREPVVKVDLNQIVSAPVRLMRKLVGMGSYRMRVGVAGSPKYKQMVVKVPAHSEKSARRTVENFLNDFLGEETIGTETGSEILDVFPPGSVWESGRHPILHLG